MDAMKQSPYLAPKARLELVTNPASLRVGRFWGVVFALPMAALALLSLQVSLRYWIEGDRSDGMFGLAVTALCGFFTALILWTGAWWARSFSAGRWAPLLGFALVCGATGQVLFWAGGMGLMAASMPKVGAPVLRLDDALAILMGWLGMSLYALLHGLMVRWSLRRIVRKQAGTTR